MKQPTGEADGTSADTSLLAYGCFVVAVVAGVSMIGAILDQKTAHEVARRTFRGGATGIGMLISLSGVFVCLELMRGRLREEYSYRYPRWWPAVARITLTFAGAVAAIWFVGEFAAAGLRSAWDWQWEVSRMIRGAARSAIIGATITLALVAWEVHGMLAARSTDRISSGS